MATDGESRVIGSGYDRTLSIWREIPTRSGTPPTVRIDEIASDQFYLVDFGFNRVHAWRNWRDAVAGQAPDTFIGATGADDIDPGISPSSLFWPKRLAIHGHRLWVGEYKFSGRVVLFETPWSTLLDPP